MANVDSPFGLKPIRHQLGVPIAATIRPYAVSSSYGTALFIGDPVIKVAGGSNAQAMSAPAAGHFPVGTLPLIEKASATTNTPITGVIVAFAALPENLDLKHNPASTARIAYVCDDPHVVFEIQANGAIPAADVGLNANLIFEHAGNPATGISGAELDTTGDTPATTATDQLKILRAINREDNDTTLPHAKVEVMINMHTQMPGVAGI